MTISSIGTRISDFARTALSAARRKPLPSAISRPPSSSPSPFALASIIRPQVRERWLLPQVGAITPQYIEMTLRGALAGAHLPQWELFNLMEDTWPRLRKNVLELKMAVRNRRAVFEAYRDEDEQESSTATERMKLVSAALRKMQPDPAADECAFDDMVGDILDAWFKGVSVLEIDWHLAQTRQLGRFVAPRCTRWASPVNYTWDSNLRLGLADDLQETLTPFPADRVIVAKCKTKSGSILGGALLRPLVWWWCAANFSADWLLNLAQVFGLPFRWATYEPTAAQETVDRICNMLQNMGSAGWAAFPAGTAFELKAEGTKSGAQTPQGDMLDRADKQCDLLVLGQTLTTDTGGMGAGGGSRALGQVHADVRAGIIDAAAKFAASVIEQQLIPSILRLNYGDADEAPTLTFHERGDDDLGARAQWITALTNAGAGRIIPLDWLAKTFGIPKPDAGEMTLGQARQEEQSMGNKNLAARIWRHTTAENDALQAGLWNEGLHPRAKGGRFGFKPTPANTPAPGSPGNLSKKPLPPPEPAPAHKPSFSSPDPSNHPEPGEPNSEKPKYLVSKKLLDGQQVLATMQPVTQRLLEFQDLRKEIRTAVMKYGRLTPAESNYAQKHADLGRRIDLMSEQSSRMEEEILHHGRELVRLPKAFRGSVPVVGSIEREIHKAVEGGRKIVANYVHSDLLPATTFVFYPNLQRAFRVGGFVFMGSAHKTLTAAHEITHGIELEHSAVLEKTRAFLMKRAAGKEPVPLNTIYPDRGYKADEMTYDDDYIHLGGDAYSGKYIGPSASHDIKTAIATELLSTGIERLHTDPALFAHSDPEFFSFVVSTLRKL